jgi:Barstar (barnase inhibitor)
VSDFVWYQHEFPWLGQGFTHAVHTDAEPGFRLRLRELGVEFFEMVGPPERSVFDQLADAYTFPDYYAQNWASFNDMMGDVSPPPRSALLWHDADRFAARDPKRFGEASACIQRIFCRLVEHGEASGRPRAVGQQRRVSTAQWVTAHRQDRALTAACPCTTSPGSARACSQVPIAVCTDSAYVIGRRRTRPGCPCAPRASVQSRSLMPRQENQLARCGSSSRCRCHSRYRHLLGR